MMLVIGPGWAEALKRAGLDSFPALWELEKCWVEPPNERRGGWSGVIKREVVTRNGLTTLFIKRQEGQNRRTLRHPYRGRPTYYLEYRFLERYGERFPQLVNWACYGEARTAGTYRAVMVTEGLTNFRDLSEIAATESRERLHEVLAEVAWAVLPLHLERLQHGALYAAHVFVERRTSEVRLIDLERSRFRTRRRSAAISDLSQFIRRTPWLDQDLLDGFIQPWEERFPGISRQLPKPREARQGIPLPVDPPADATVEPETGAAASIRMAVRGSARPNHAGGRRLHHPEG